MILLLSKNQDNTLSVSDNAITADYQVLISRVKHVNMQMNKKHSNGVYKALDIESEEVEEIRKFILENYPNVKRIENSLFEE